MKRILVLLILFCFAFTASGQIIPDLTVGDHFQPNLSEDQKQEQILKSQKGYPKTSEELYPHLYKYTNQDYLGPIKGTQADPVNAFRNYGQVGFANTTPSKNYPLPQSVYDPGLSIQQRSQAIIDADLASYNSNNERANNLVNEALKELDGPSINYSLGIHSGPAVNPFIKAYSELEGMLSGKQKIDFPKAVWLVEHSVDPSLSWEEFNRMFQNGVQIIQRLIVQDKLSPQDNLAKIMAIYKYMTDTTSVFMPSRERVIVSKPMLYDFDDFKAEKDITKVFVSKLLRTGSGQCMSLPMLYYLFAKALKADVNIAFAPQHSYITFMDNLGVRQNIELTGRIFTTSDFLWQSGFIKSEQVKSGIYLTPISEKETISYLLTTLTLSYIKKFGVDDRVMQMAMTAKEHFPHSLTANMIQIGYSHELWKNVERQYQIFELAGSRLQTDEKARAIKEYRDGALKHLYKDLGWAKMPDWAYKKWLDGVNELANKRQHIVQKRQLEQQLNK